MIIKLKQTKNKTKNLIATFDKWVKGAKKYAIGDFLKFHLIQCLIFNFNLPFLCIERELSHEKRRTSLQKELELTRGSLKIVLQVFEHLERVSSLC